MQDKDETELRNELSTLKAQHRELDDEILALEQKGTSEQFLLRRLKKQKLALKDQIQKIEDQLLPDIIA